MSTGSITREIADGVLDAELAGLLWLLAEAGVPLTVTGPPGSGRGRMRAAILGLSGRAGWSAAAVNPGMPVEGGVHAAASLDELLAILARPPHNLSPDELRDLGVVVVLGRSRAGDRRLLSAHYMRPVERDREGHLQRRPPAVLSAWDEAGGRLEHFAWGVTTELAARAGMSAPVFEAAHLERTAFLGGLAAAGVVEPVPLARAIDGYRLLGASGRHEGH